jgi:hypothetical protein
LYWTMVFGLILTLLMAANIGCLLKRKKGRK